MADLELIALLTARLKQLEAKLPNTVAQAAESALKSWAEVNRESLQGKSADPITVDDIRAVVMPWLAENITQPKDGNDADPINMAEIAAIVNTWLTVHYADLLPSHAVIEQIATTWLADNIKQPKDGNDATIEQIRTVAESWLRDNISQPKDGEDGETPEHEWNGSLLRFKNPDGTWGKWVNLRGERGFGGGAKGDKGDTGPQGIQGEKGVDGESSAAEVGEISYSRFTLGAKYLLLDGSTYNVDDYPDLGALYGGTAGGTFTVDDWRGVPIFGADGSNTSGTKTGTDTVDLSHAHGVGSIAGASAGGHNHGGNTGDTGSQAVGTLSLLSSAAPPNHNHSIGTDGAHTHTMSGNTASALSTVDKRPKRAYANVYIRALP